MHQVLSGKKVLQGEAANEEINAGLKVLSETLGIAARSVTLPCPLEL